MYKSAVLLLCIAGICSASVLLTNGDFEQPLTTGWEQYAGGYYSFVGRGTTYNPDPDYEACATDSFGGIAELSQTVDIPTTDLQFACELRLYAYDNNADTLCWAAAALVISYLDANGVVLGQTKICRYTAPCDWANSSTCHLIVAPNTNWNSYSFNINTELGNLPGVAPAQVKKIKISLLADTDHTC